MSGGNNSPVPLGACDWQNPTTWRRPCNEPITNESSVNVGSDMLPSLSDTITSSPQYFDLNATLLIPPTLNHNSYTSGNAGVFLSGSPSASLCLPNVGQNNVNLIGGDNHSQGGYGYQCEQDRRHEQRSNSCRGTSGCMPTCMQFRREQPRPYMVPTISPPMYPMFISNVFPSNCYSTHEVPNDIPYFPSNEYNNSARPQFQYLCRPSSVSYQGFYAALQSKFSFLLFNLRANLQEQIEYYFSSENLHTDSYLKEHMDDHGCVPITLIAQFKRVQQLMKERQLIYDSFRIWSFMEMQVQPLADKIQFILDSLRPSYVVEVQGDKVRKRHEWEKWVSRS
ncbi:la-related protein 1C-like [Phalaenopsis equestris]|uniref:la-related protein 1C-like n=1 Tax=Phalaenopsis equestris TaxID=78828 RepID=UPI0009E5B4F3|nr:la-related protein 1C-like [Phalaenopsis equestris]